MAKSKARKASYQKNCQLATKAHEQNVLQTLKDEAKKLKNELEKVLKEKNEILCDIENWKKKEELSENDKRDLQLKLNSLKQNYCNLMSEMEAHKKQFGNELKTLKEKIPFGGRRRKIYTELSEEYKKDRVAMYVDYISSEIGDSNIDDFTKKWIKIVSKNAQYQFSMRLSPWESFYLVTKLHFTNSMIKEIKRHSQRALGFDFLAPRKMIEELRRESDPYKDYNIGVETTKRYTRNGKLVDVQSPFAAIKDVKRCVQRRLESLSRRGAIEYNAFTKDDIVLGITGDKGGSETKLCLMFGNLQKPNNSHSLLMLGFYSASDDHANLLQKFGDVFDQLNRLTVIQFSVNGEEISKNVRIFLIGDCKYMSSMSDHPGQAASCPCYICHIRWVMKGYHVDKVGSFSFEIPGEPRTLDESMRDGRPLLLLDPSLLGIPPLHTITGVFQYYVLDYLYAYCNRIDNKLSNLPDSLNNQRKVLNNYKKQEQVYAKRIEGLKSALALTEAVIVVVSKVKNAVRGRKQTDPMCQAHFCFINWLEKKLRNQELFVCCICKTSVHLCCAAILTPDDSFRIQEGKAKCLTCQKKPDIVTIHDVQQILNSSKKTIEDQIEIDDFVMMQAKEKRETLQSQLEKSGGVTRQNFENVLKHLKCDPRVWHTSVTGNQARILLRQASIDLILSVFPDDDTTRVMRIVMEKLAIIMTHSNASLKTDPDIQLMEETVASFVDALRKAQPDAGISVKLHLLTAHMIPFLKRNNTWSHITDQAIEAVHPTFNELKARFSAVRDPILFAALILRHYDCYNRIFDYGDSWKVDE
ncbi:unnamed protein product [Caenorhabditis brenneri]